MRMSNTKPMKNTMRKQSPMKMVDGATGALKTVKAGIDKVTEAAAKGKAKKADATTSKEKPATVKSKPTNFKEAVRKNAADRSAAKAAAKAAAKDKPATGLRGKLEAFKAKVAAKKAATEAKRTNTTKVEGPKPKPTGAAPKAATTKTNPGTTKTNLSTTKTAPTMMKKMGKSSCGK